MVIISRKFLFKFIFHLSNFHKYIGITLLSVLFLYLNSVQLVWVNKVRHHSSKVPLHSLLFHQLSDRCPWEIRAQRWHPLPAKILQGLEHPREMRPQFGVLLHQDHPVRAEQHHALLPLTQLFLWRIPRIKSCRIKNCKWKPGEKSWFLERNLESPILLPGRAGKRMTDSHRERSTLWLLNSLFKALLRSVQLLGRKQRKPST